MRDIERMESILAAVRVVWEQNPDMRLGQLIVNAQRHSDIHASPFYLDDEELIYGLTQMYR